MSDTPSTPATFPPGPDAPRPAPTSRRLVAAIALLGAIAIGAGATALAQRGPATTLIALAPAPIASMTDGSLVAVKGEVAEIFGNKFVVADGSGRALVETGPMGDDGKLVAAAETLTVQGRFDHGFIHALAIQHANGRTVMVGPPGPPPPPPRPLGPAAPERVPG